MRRGASDAEVKEAFLHRLRRQLLRAGQPGKPLGLQVVRVHLRATARASARTRAGFQQARGGGGRCIGGAMRGGRVG